MSAFDDFLSGETYQKKKEDKEKMNDLLAKILEEQLSVREVLEDIADMLEMLVQKSETPSGNPNAIQSNEGDDDAPQPLITSTNPSYRSNVGTNGSAFTQANMSEDFIARAGRILDAASEGPVKQTASVPGSSEDFLSHASAILGDAPNAE